VGLWWTKRHWGRFSPSTSVSPATHFTNFSIFTIRADRTGVGGNGSGSCPISGFGIGSVEPSRSDIMMKAKHERIDLAYNRLENGFKLCSLRRSVANAYFFSCSK
jgi:hypothetical protein